MIETIEDLEALYGTPKQAALVKVTKCIIPEYRAYIEASPFVALATVGPAGTDCTPRGDEGQVVFIEDETTLHLPDRMGNNRMDSLRNLVQDPRCSLMFLIPGSYTVIRVNCTAKISVEASLLARYAHKGKAPRSVLVFSVGEVYFQCGKAIIRSGLWKAEAVQGLPSAGRILKATSQGEVGGDDYDKAWPARAQETLW